MITFSTPNSIAQQNGVSMRTAAYIHALNRLGDALDAKGTREYYLNGSSH